MSPIDLTQPSRTRPPPPPGRDGEGRAQRCAVHVTGSQDWSPIRDPAVSLLLQRRQALAAWSLGPEQSLRVRAPTEAVVGRLLADGSAAARDAAELARRFARLMGAPELRLRLERLSGAPCTKIHADYCDVRLIVAYAGPGSDYLSPSGQIERVPTGWVALFKGLNFPGDGHRPCAHRSPEAAGGRTLLVIDTAVIERKDVRWT